MCENRASHDRRRFAFRFFVADQIEFGQFGQKIRQGLVDGFDALSRELAREVIGEFINSGLAITSHPDGTADRIEFELALGRRVEQVKEEAIETIVSLTVADDRHPTGAVDTLTVPVRGCSYWK